jgi:hypothetical protein
MSDNLRTTLRAQTLARLEKHATVRVGMTPDDVINEVLDKLEERKK